MSKSIKDDLQEDGTRRNFIKLGMAAACGSAFCACGKKQEGEKVELLSPEGEVVEIDAQHVHHVHKTVGVSREEARKGIADRKFVMVIDLGRCNNARKCVTACQKMHHLPEDKEWLVVLIMRESDKEPPFWFPKTCFHCDNPPCVKVCPVNATFKRDDGLVLIDNERCIGCKFCMAACPYSTRVFNWDEPEQPEAIANMESSPETSLPRKIGTVEKCDFCPDMVRQGLLPDCVTACPNGVFYFGDENEDVVTNGVDTVRFSQLIKDKGGYRYKVEFGTEPRVWYLPPRDRLFPVERGMENLPEDLKDMVKDMIDDYTG
jgi:molybdopterin-containing oxidoreductase family iron-sulfur binding subunit